MQMQEEEPRATMKYLFHRKTEVHSKLQYLMFVQCTQKTKQNPVISRLRKWISRKQNYLP